jgi:hypothetical protein
MLHNVAKNRTKEYFPTKKGMLLNKKEHPAYVGVTCCCLGLFCKNFRQGLFSGAQQNIYTIV